MEAKRTAPFAVKVEPETLQEIKRQCERDRVSQATWVTQAAEAGRRKGKRVRRGR